MNSDGMLTVLRKAMALRGAAQEAVWSTALVPIPVDYRPHNQLQTPQYDPVDTLPRRTHDHNCFWSKPCQSASNIAPEHPICLQFSSLMPVPLSVQAM